VLCWIQNSHGAKRGEGSTQNYLFHFKQRPPVYTRSLADGTAIPNNFGGSRNKAISCRSLHHASLKRCRRIAETIEISRFRQLKSHRDRRPISGGVFLRPLMILFVLGKKRLEAVVHLCQFPENRKKLNRDYEQQELDHHFLASRGKKRVTSESYITSTGSFFFNSCHVFTISVQRSRLSLVRSSKRVSCVSCRSDFSPVIQVLGRFAIIPVRVPLQRNIARVGREARRDID
jgi:hypothetical protein